MTKTHSSIIHVNRK